MTLSKERIGTLKIAASLLAFAALSHSAFAVVSPWFDAGVAGYDAWPSDGADKVVAGAGTWSNTQCATLEGSAPTAALAVEASGTDLLTFAASEPTNAASATVAVSATLVLGSVAGVTELPAVDGSVKAGLTVGLNEGAAAFFGRAKDPLADPAANTWVALSGATPAAGSTAFKILVKTENGVQYVQYEVGGTVLTAGGEAWLEIVAADATVNGAKFAGADYSIAALSAKTDDGVIVPAALTIPELPENVAVASVMTNGVAVVADEETGVYTVADGATVVVTFAPAAGYVLTGAAAVSVEMNGDTAVALASIPTAVDPASYISINEIMASNPDPAKDENALVSINGGAEMDWVELYNAADFDIDLAGWYFSDKPNKPTKSPIYGSCVVPAKGYKILWLDDAYQNWDATEAHADIGLSSSGEAAVLAKADGTIVQSIEFPAQIKGYSYGPGTVSYGKHQGEGPYVYMKTATPGAANVAEGWSDFTPAVAFSEPHGYKTESFELTITCADAPDEPIYYTLDGSSPTTSSTLYEGPITISKTTVVRAAIPDSGSVLQQDVSATYLFLDDILAQETSTTAPESAVGFPGSGTVKSHLMRYGFNQAIVNGADRDRLLKGFTNSIATVSFVIDPASLFDANTGIYVNPAGRGQEWERQLMFEQFDPTGVAADFTVPAGLRIRGSHSRTGQFPKHAFRMYFRSSYGMSSLAQNMFPGDETAATEYDKIDFRCSSNYSWANEESDADTFVHEVFSRDSQGDMGQFHTRSRYYNLFINGQYWGLYQTQERGEEHFAESYAGGDSLDWDVIKTTSANGGYDLEADEGTMDGWTNLWQVAVENKAGLSADAIYQRVLGNDPDGTRNPAYPELLNATNLMAYVLLTHYILDGDGPVTPPSKHLNNMYCLRDRTDGPTSVHGFFFLRHDGEMSFAKRNGSYKDDPTGWGSGDSLTVDSFNKYDTYWNTFEGFSPVKLHWELEKSADYRRACADQLYKFFIRPGGAMTTEKNIERFAKRMAEIDDAIVCESARWGMGGKTGNKNFTRTTWLNACKTCTNGFLAVRMPYFIQQYKDRGWYPSVEAPLVTDDNDEPRFAGDVIPAGEYVYLLCETEGATIYYTLDGSDPIAADGSSPSATATLYNEEFAISGAVTLKARAVKDGVWSALEEVPLKGVSDEYADLTNALRVAAIYTSTTDGGDTGEFIVLTNILDDASVNLGGGRLVAWNAKNKTEASPSLSIDFGNIVLGPGESVTLEKDADFNGGKLTNSKVGLKIYDVSNNLVQEIFVDADWWNAACDNTGAWFVAKEFGAAALERTCWKPSAATVIPSYLRVAALYTSTSGDGDTGEFITLTNTSESVALDLADVRIVAWNAKKKSEAEPSLVIDLTNVVIAAGASATLDQATYFGEGGKLTNSQVGLRIYDAAGALAQDVYVDAGWWDSACDGTGRWFVATNFNAEAKTEADWEPSPEAPAIPLPLDADAKAVALAAIDADPAVADWLVALGSTAEGLAAIEGFTGDAEAFATCYLVDIPLADNPAVELTIPSITVNPDGTVTVDGSIEIGGVEAQDKTVRGEVRLYWANALEDLDTSTDYIVIDPPTFPVTTTDEDNDNVQSRFYRLKIK